MRFAVLGCGSIGRRHLRSLRALGQAELIAFDPVPEARHRSETEFEIKCYGLLEDLWSQKPEVVLITAPSAQHLGLALAAAERNCHLFIEKPLSHSLEGIPELLKTVEQRGLITMVGCNMRFHPGPMMVKRLIDEQAVGRILAARIQTASYLPDWRPWQNYQESYSANVHGGGALLDCIHEVDLALWYLGPGYLAAALTQPAESLGLEVEGLAELLIQHERGAIANVHLNFVQRDYRRCCQVIGENGTIYWDFSRPRVEVYDTDGHVQTIELDPDWKLDQMYIDEMSYFIDCLEHGKQTFCSAKEGLAALQLVIDAKAMRASPIGSTSPA